ncbi:macrophage mannose receptor 1-like isoform X2 [Paramisgurnus dabryanus]|uniref:macrophage mannose receptor 1-like isoform X2 n=1 Tax=Paramisgurnus dabryanus TaxID=90735 RepID=UPI0031F3C9CC
MVKHQRGAVRAVTNMSLFLLLLLSGLLCSASGSDRKYFYIDIRMNWTDAQSYCRERYTDLATVDSMDDVNRMINTVNDRYIGSVWIGLQRATQSRWGWSMGDDTVTQYSGWSPNPTPENTGYIRKQINKTWTDAQSYCRQYHTDLATVRNSKDQNQLIATVGYGPWVWIGLFLDSWQWSDQWNLFFRNWPAGYPSQTTGSGDCAAMSITYSGKWFQYSCDLQRPFFCYEWPKTRQYHYINKNLNWSEAQSYCRARYTDLATVDSMKDVNIMTNIRDVAYIGPFWIGLKRVSQSRWGWSMGDDTLTNYSGWSSNPGNDECAYFAYGFWYSKQCSGVLYFACYNESTGYIKIEIYKTWRDAQSYCRQYHTDLATVRSPDEQSKLYAVVGHGPWVWIGLFKDSWQWSDQWSLFFRNWAAGYPSQTTGSGDCAAMSITYSGKWFQYSCNLHGPFVCYGWPKTRQYHYINKNLKWSEAQSYCRERYTDLATVDSIVDVNIMTNITDVGYNGSVWIGLKRMNQSRWGWSRGDDTLTKYSGWRSNPGNEECAYFAYGYWYSYQCSTQLFFACYNETTGYIKINDRKNWTDAQSYCRQYHTDLATVRSPDEQSQLYAVVGDGPWVWIGLFKDSWQWSDQWSLFFRNWAAGDPSQTSGSGDCAAISTTNSGKWVQHSCDLQHPFICHGGTNPLYQQCKANVIF